MRVGDLYRTEWKCIYYIETFTDELVWVEAVRGHIDSPFASHWVADDIKSCWLEVALLGGKIF
jgi:hypothetical protein